MVAAYKAATADGVDPLDFWELTPYQTRLAMSGLRDGRMSLAWTIAALSRHKKLPKLETLLTKTRKRDPMELMQTLKGFNRG